MVIHVASYNYKCEKCDYESKRATDFKIHKCKLKTYECDICKKKSANAVGLKKHKIRHHT